MTASADPVMGDGPLKRHRAHPRLYHGSFARIPDIFRPIRDGMVDQSPPTQLDKGKIDRRKLV